MINPVNFGPAILKRFMAPDVPGLETFATSPSLCFFLEHPSGRRLVWDLGIRKDYDHYAPSIKDYLPTTKYTIEVTKNVAEILQEHGIELNSIEAVIWSHHHWDHIGDPSTFHRSTKLIVGPGFKQAMLPGAPANPQSPILESDYAPDTFILLGGDVCHYAGILRPSEYLPVPKCISPHPCRPMEGGAVLCPGSAWEELQNSRGRKVDDTLLDMTYGMNIPLASQTVHSLQQFDCLENIFVIIAHDSTVRDGAPHFPKTLNDWKARGLGEGLKWSFFRDLNYEDKDDLPNYIAWEWPPVHCITMGSADDFSKHNWNGQHGLSDFMSVNQGLDYDVLIVGAGLSGLYSLIRMRELGVRARVLEAGSAEGGTWYWNRYPGARFDSESYSYIFSFSQEVLDEWDWTEHFSPQPETLRYIQYLTIKFNLKDDLQFNTRIKTAHFQQSTNSWMLTDSDGKSYSSRYLVTAMGILNEPTLPNIPGIHDYKGEAWHTARWPSDKSLEGKRVGIIGTGATAIQTIQAIHKSVSSLTVFQRTPNWTAPLRNTKITPKEMKDIRNRYPEIFKRCLDSYSCFIHVGDTRSVFDMKEDERENLWESLYQLPGFAKVLGISGNIYTDREANRLYSDFQANKIRQRLKDPKLAEKLIPKNHGFGTRRVPLESGYYEAFNEPHVKLVDLTEDPIETFTENGIRTKAGEFEFDAIIYATGFDAVTGSFRAVDFAGIDGLPLTDVWAEGINTFLGLTVKGFPNMFMVMGPHQMFGNIPRSIEYAVGWIADFIRYARDHGITYAEATDEGMRTWTEHVWKCGEGLLANEVDSWMTGVNKNLAHKQKRSMTRYNGPAPGYRARCDAVKARNYSDFVLR
ncbi:hypothetical protein J7T55_002390 [Diaporthe amygdali]|uniref:uncharacterized protein n=1 Tax=Phomopsis amygdali TaxID=1214568 RepID=UPI0022FDF5B3|nr:uncharacterized protein J7T55_002390 [Diaporthe amygdali]KAJ0121881.1 hypothetical protein J7T55_002390 [Diaporthe amygdali]